MMGPWALRLGGPSPAGPMESAPMHATAKLAAYDVHSLIYSLVGQWPSG